MKNPIDIFLDCIENLDTRSQAYATRPIFGKINSAMIGIIARQVREETSKSTGGIDAYNDSLADALARKDTGLAMSNMGLETRSGTSDTLRQLMAVKEALRERINLDDELLDLIDDPSSSLTYMSQPRIYTQDHLEKTAALLEIDVEVLRAAAASNNERNAKQLRIISFEVMARFRDIESFATDDFDNLDPTYKARIFQSIETSLGKQYQNAASSALQGSGARLADLPFIKAGVSELRAWSKTAAMTDPDLAADLAA